MVRTEEDPLHMNPSRDNLPVVRMEEDPPPMSPSSPLKMITKQAILTWKSYWHGKKSSNLGRLHWQKLPSRKKAQLRSKR